MARPVWFGGIKKKWFGTSIAKLTDSTAGTAAASLVAMPDISGVPGALGDAATQADVNASLELIRDNFASVNAKLNALMDALDDAGITS